MPPFLTKGGTGEFELTANALGFTTCCDKTGRKLIQTDVIDAAERSQASITS